MTRPEPESPREEFEGAVDKPAPNSNINYDIVSTTQQFMQFFGPLGELIVDSAITSRLYHGNKRAGDKEVAPFFPGMNYSVPLASYIMACALDPHANSQALYEAFKANIDDMTKRLGNSRMVGYPSKDFIEDMTYEFRVDLSRLDAYIQRDGSEIFTMTLLDLIKKEGHQNGKHSEVTRTVQNGDKEEKQGYFAKHHLTTALMMYFVRRHMNPHMPYDEAYDEFVADVRRFAETHLGKEEGAYDIPTQEVVEMVTEAPLRTIAYASPKGKSAPSNGNELDDLESA